jgi:CheY-like chemotaxis protein
MMHLIDDLLDVARIASGKVELRKKQLDLRHVIAKAVELASPLFEQKRHHLAVDAPASEMVVTADEARLTQVLANLLTNAAKYTAPAGRITISAKQVDGQTIVEVSDNGTGIGPDLLPRIFDVFVQGYQSSERSGGGLGLGLSLVKSLVGLHGGSVHAHSAGLGMGSRFTVTLPPPGLSLVPESESNRVDPALTVGQERILVVDDNEDARVLLAELLRSVGYEVRTVGDGPEALELVRTYAPTVAILDIGLPVIDGYELAVKLRETLGTATPAMIAVTGYGQETDRQRSAGAGFIRHLVKPVDLRQLLDAIAEIRAAR